MASLWKRKNSPFFTCCYESASGQRLKKSTKQTERSKAWNVCLALERAEQSAKEDALTEETAKKLIGEVLERTTGRALRRHKTGPWLDKWVKGKKEIRAPKTAERYEQVIRDFKASLGKRANLPLETVSAYDVLAYRDNAVAEGISNTTANNAVKIISAAFNSAFRHHLIPHNPCTAIESLEVDSTPKGTFTTEQVGVLIKTADEMAAQDQDHADLWRQWSRAIIFEYYTGARLGDVANIRWSAIDLKAGLIRFCPKKTERKKIEVLIPIHPQLLAMLMAGPGVGMAYVFPALAETSTGGIDGLSTQFADIMDEAGIDRGGTINPKTKRNIYRLSFHSLRHSFNSELANAGVSQEVRMKLTGHTDAKTNKIYTHHEVAALRSAVEKLPSVG